MSNPFLKFLGLGYRPLVPLIPVGAAISPSSWLSKRATAGAGKDPRGKMPGVLSASGWHGKTDWTADVDCTSSECMAWHEMGADVGLRRGGAPRLVGIDADTMSHDLSTKVWWIAHDHFGGGRHAKRTGRAPKWALLLRVSGVERVPYRFVEFTGKDGAVERVEALSNGKQLKVWGQHPLTNAPYTWEPDVPAYADLVEVSPQQIADFFAELERVLPDANRVRAEGGGSDKPIATLRGDPDMIEAAVRRLPNSTKHFPTREDFVGIGYAIKGAIADEQRALACFVDWADRWDDDPSGKGNDFGYAEAVWRTLHPRQKGAGWLLEKFAEVTGEPVATHWFEPIAEPEPSIWDAAPPSPASEARPAFELVDFVDAAGAALSELSKPLIKGLLDTMSLSLMFGPSGAGKTFTAMDLAFHVALGLPWNGLRVQQAVTVYIAAEGAVGARKRSDALRRRHGISDAQMRGRFFYRMANVDLFHPDADLAGAIEAIAAVPNVGLVVVDTLSAVFAGGDENSPVDMGVLVKNLNKLRVGTSAHVMGVHHTGKDEARGARGHSLLKAALDTELEVLDGRLTATKQREIETGFALPFSLDVVSLGVDPDGDPVTSCVVRWAERGASAAPKPVEQKPLADGEMAVLGALRVECETPEHHGRGVKVPDLLDALGRRGVKTRYDTLRRTLTRMSDKGWATVENGLWRPVETKAPLTIEGDVFA